MKRFAALDALRGLAALSVVFAHVHSVFSKHHQLVDLTPLFILWAGGEAVILFFVLSGIVLVKRAESGSPQSWPAFLTGRFFRIGIPHLLVTFCCVFLSWAAIAQGHTSAHGLQWPQELDWQVVAGHVLMVGDYDSMAFNDVIWTLVHELRFALVFPLFMVLLRMASTRQVLAVLGGMSVLAALYVTWQGDPSTGFKTAYVYTAHYLLIFGAGALLLRHLPAGMARLERLGPRQQVLWVLGALMLYAYARMVYLVPQRLGWPEVAAFNAFVADALVAVAACALMLASLSFPRLREVLERRPLQYLGEVSFSLYLVHLPVMKVCFLLMPDAPTWLAVVCALPVIAAVTHVFHHGVERPTQDAGRDASRWVESTWRAVREPLSDLWRRRDDFPVTVAAGSEGAGHPEAADRLGQ